MTDIFDATILCKNCNIKMIPIVVNRAGIEVRAVKCRKCHEQIIHPADLNALENFNNIKGKTYNVKLRMVGNSHAISIPKEIVDFIRQQEKIMDDMVRLCFEDMHKLSLSFGNFEKMGMNQFNEEENERSDTDFIDAEFTKTRRRSLHGR